MYKSIGLIIGICRPVQGAYIGLGQAPIEQIGVIHRDNFTAADEFCNTVNVHIGYIVGAKSAV